MAKITVLGCGFGTALAIVAHNNGHEVVLWSPFKEEIDGIISSRRQEKLLPGVDIPAEIIPTTDLSMAEGSDAIITAVPSRFMREVAGKLKTVKNRGIIVNVSKGIESGSLLRLSQVLKEELPEDRIVVLSGPSHAEEVARSIPTTIVSASEDPEAAAMVQELLMNRYLRIYTNDDMVGVELGGALKNIIALAAGVVDGLGFGDNTKAALITRGIAEMRRLGVAMGANSATFAGLAGIGDLVVTCTSMHSRNRRFGMLVGQGVPPEEALDRVGTVEGYYATAIACEMGKKAGVEMPITEKCYGVLYGGIDPKTALYELMCRPLKSEYDFLFN